MGSIGNLGDYQRLSMAAKAVGGPKNLFLLVSGASAVVATATGLSVKNAIDNYKQNKKLQKEAESLYFTVSSSGTDNQGLSLNRGDKFRVLDRNKDIILIDVWDRNDNPFYVSADFLRDISDFV